MIHTLAMYRGAVMGRLVDPKAIDLAALDIEINNACEELGARVEDMREAWLDQRSWIPLITDQDVYPLPKNCRTLIRLERWEPEQLAPHAMRRINENGAEIAESELYDRRYFYEAIENNQIRLLVAPTVNNERGLRALYVAKVVPLLDADATLPISDAAHEWVVWAALDRVRQYAGVQLANPQDFERCRLEQNMRLLRFLRPKNLDYPAQWGDEDELS